MQLRDVTRETAIESNVPDVARVETDASADMPVIRGERVGEATLLVRYQGKFATIPVTVLNPKPGFVWKPLPQNNYIDRLVDAKLERLKIQPSASTDDAHVLPPRIARSHRTPAFTRECPCLPGRCQAVARETREDDRQAHRQSRHTWITGR